MKNTGIQKEWEKVVHRIDNIQLQYSISLSELRKNWAIRCEWIKMWQEWCDKNESKFSNQIIYKLKKSNTAYYHVVCKQ